METNRSKPVGLTASVGYQIGVRRTLPFDRNRAWELLTSKEGLKLWLGSAADLPGVKGEPFETAEGTIGEMRVYKPKEQLRLTWQLKEWESPSTLQIRLLPASSSDKTTVSFHQDHLASNTVREQMKQKWENVLAAFTEL